MSDENMLLTESYEERKGIRRQFFNGALSIYEAGQMTLDGKVIDFEQGIKLAYNVKTLKVSAFYLLGLVKAVTEDDEVYDKLCERARKEQEEYNTFTF